MRWGGPVVGLAVGLVAWRGLGLGLPAAALAGGAAGVVADRAIASYVRQRAAGAVSDVLGSFFGAA